MHKQVARVRGTCRIDRDVTFIDVPDNPFLVYHEGSTIAEPLLLIENPIVLNNCPFKVTKEWKGNADLFSELAVGRDAVYTNTKNLRVGCFEFGDISLIRLHLLRSTAGESQNIESKNDVLLTSEVAELVCLAICASQGKLWSSAAYLEMSFRYDGLLSVRGQQQAS